MMVEDFAFEAGMVFLTPAPLYHAAPLRMMMAVQRLGGTVIAFSKFDEVGVLEAIPRFSATHGFFVPTMFVRMLRLPPESRAAVDLSSLRVAIHAAAPCPAPIKHRMIEWWGPVIYEVYGGTEAVGHTVISPQDWLAHPGSVGRPPAGCRLEVRNDAGRVLGPGETGLVYFANGNRFAYYKDAQKTAETCTVDGFATFGDIGHVDEAGYLYLTDRKADMIISGGVNIYPQEAERVLLGHPAVADVAIFGIPDEEFGEQVKALIETFEPPADAQGLEREILDYCRAHLSPIKCPRSVEFVDRLPRNDLGKIAKHELKRHYWRDRATLIV
jgi:long-chain acyl-CoA synthetase